MTLDDRQNLLVLISFSLQPVLMALFTSLTKYLTRYVLSFGLQFEGLIPSGWERMVAVASHSWSHCDHRQEAESAEEVGPGSQT